MGNKRIDFIGDAVGESIAKRKRKERYKRKKITTKQRKLIRRRVERVVDTVNHIVEEVQAGRSIVYQPRFVQAAKHASIVFGNTDAELAQFFGVDRLTILKWKREYPRFAKACEVGKLEADAKVAARLYRRATGYEIAEEKLFMHEGEVIRAETTKHYPVETGAATFWLKNRQPHMWRDRVELTGKDGSKLDAAQQTIMLIQNVTQEQASKAYTDLVELEDGTFGAVETE